MSGEILVPSVGESINEVVISRWLVEVGTYVAQDTPVVEVETEKATVEVPAPIAGILKSVAKNQDDVAEAFSAFLANFYQAHPNTRTKQLWLTGESYAGKYDMRRPLLNTCDIVSRTGTCHPSQHASSPTESRSLASQSAMG